MENRLMLDGAWKWRASDEDANQLHNGIVPGSVMTDMLRDGLMQDPFWRTNEYTAKQLSRREYTYIKTFAATDEMLCAKQATLVFEGLDTLATVTLNDKKLINCDDMHRTYTIDVTGMLEKENTLIVHFASPLAFIENADKNGDIRYASTGCQRGNGALRKAHYMFGWDWGPQLPDAGIWRNVYINFCNNAHIEDVRIRQSHSNSKVTLDIEQACVNVSGAALTAQYTLTAPDGTRLVVDGAAHGHTEMCVENPQLWWPNGYGAQPLYTLQATLFADGKEADSRSYTLGLRTITVCTDADEWGNQFAFVINGQKIFAMGANYVPEDNLLGRLSKQRSERLVADCAKANFNCIRVWGGGYYPEDYFYDACDKYGILVWQDLMFACNVYDLNDTFEANILAETADNVRRIRHHACLGLWCGNNEMEWGWATWGRLEGHRPKYKADYIKIFEMLLPRQTQKYDDQTFYWLSSPSSGGSFDDPNDFDRGDNHYWEVWHSNKPFTEYRDFHFRFCSEFGFQSFPHKKTIDSFSLPQDRNIFSEVMESHQKNGLANTKIFSYISGYYKYPNGMDNIAYISQILQLKAIQYGVEHWRRNWGRCMGSIYWQLNDCWPVASWASVDYNGRWKALHYGAKRFYARFMATACEKEEFSTEIDYYIHNESFHARKATLTVRLFDTALNTLYTQSTDVTANAFETKCALSVNYAGQLTDEDMKKCCAAEYTLTEEGVCVSRGTSMFTRPKYFDYKTPHYTADITDAGESFAVHIGADTFANYVELYFENVDAVFSDNYFDITSRNGVTVYVGKNQLDKSVTAEKLMQELHIKSVADSF